MLDVDVELLVYACSTESLVDTTENLERYLGN